MPRIWFLLHTLRTDTSPSTQTAIFIFGLHETKHPALQNSNKLLHISQVGFVHNDWFGNKAIPFLVNKTGTIVQRTSVAVIWLSGKESATGQFHDGLRWSAMITSIVLKWLAFENRSYLCWVLHACCVLSFQEETRMSPFLPRKGSVHLSLGLILRTIMHNSGVVWQLCNWFTVQFYFLSPTASVLFGVAASMRTCKDAAEFPSSCRQCWMSHAAVKSRQINSKHYGSSHISLALSGNTGWTEYTEVSYAAVVKINSKYNI